MAASVSTTEDRFVVEPVGFDANSLDGPRDDEDDDEDEGDRTPGDDDQEGPVDDGER